MGTHKQRQGSYASFLPLLLLCIAALSPGACASTTPRYQAPAMGPVASLTIKTTAPHRNIRVVSYTGLQNAESEGSLITIFNSATAADGTGRAITIDISAGQPFRFSTTITDTVSYAGKVITSFLCKTHSRFMPQADTRYLAWHSSLAGGDCKMEVFRIDANDTRLPEPTLEDLAWCIDPQVDDPAYLEKYPDRACP